MGSYDRDYMRDQSRGGGGIPSPRQWSVVTWLLVLNIGYYLIDIFPLQNAHIGKATLSEILSGHVYQLITYMFVHGSLIHLAFNMITLFFVGRGLLQLVTPRQFLMIYFGGGILGVVLQLALFPGTALLGASAGVIAVLIALASLMPMHEIYLMIMFIIPVRMKLRTIAFLVVGIDLVRLVGASTLGWKSNIGHLAHLGGALFGWLFITFILPKLRARVSDGERQGRWQQRFGTRQVVDAEYVEEKSGRRKKPKKEARQDQTFVSEDVDAILDKISEHGMQSLTAKERKLLERSSEKLSRRVDRHR